MMFDFYINFYYFPPVFAVDSIPHAAKISSPREARMVVKSPCVVR